MDLDKKHFTPGFFAISPMTIESALSHWSDLSQQSQGKCKLGLNLQRAR
jgi:hypothetical protein